MLKFIILLFVASVSTPPLFCMGKCGTPLIFQQQTLSKMSQYTSPGKSAADWAARTYATDNFTIHYALTGPHKVKTIESDSGILNIYEAFYNLQSPALTEKEKQQGAYDQMELQSSSHPIYIIKLGEYLELAWTEYVVNSNMKLAETTRESRYFLVPAIPGKYQIDVVDISEAEGYHGSEIYGLTYPPGQGEGMLIENDFLFNSGTGLFPDYQPITTVYNRGPEAIVVDYSVEWDKALKVAAVHEFYHAIHYGYTPSIIDFHFWYEASATGREESLAPDVNDYLQYLPTTFDRHASSSLTRNCSSCLESFGNGIFFTYLGFKLGGNFEKGIWENLENNMPIEEAIEAVFSAANTSMNELYSGFVHPLAFTQSQNPNPFEVYSEDISIWPIISRNELDMASIDEIEVELPPLTYTVFDIKRGSPFIGKKLELTMGEYVTVATSYNGSTLVQNLDSNLNEAIISDPVNDAHENLMILSNNSWDQSATVKLTPFVLAAIDEKIVVPNPFSIRGGPPNILITRPGFENKQIEVQIYNELGRMVKTLTLSFNSGEWNWNQTGINNEIIAPGMYFMKINDQPVMKVFVLGN